MAVSRSLRRLLRVLNIEEEQCKSALETALGELSRIERAVTAAEARARSGRQLVSASARTGELPDRLAGLEEAHAAKRRTLALASRMIEAQSNVETLRQEFLAKRVECRQAETLIREAEIQDALVAGRRTQQGLDDWYLNRMHSMRGASSAPVSARPAGPMDSGKPLSKETPELPPQS
jgi:hypothetical protein